MTLCSSGTKSCFCCWSLLAEGERQEVDCSSSWGSELDSGSLDIIPNFILFLFCIAYSSSSMAVRGEGSGENTIARIIV